MNTATGLSRLARLVSQGVSRLPTSVWITIDVPPTAIAMLIEPNCRNATNAEAAAVTREPM